MRGCQPLVPLKHNRALREHIVQMGGNGSSFRQNRVVPIGEKDAEELPIPSEELHFGHRAVLLRRRTAAGSVLRYGSGIEAHDLIRRDQRKINHRHRAPHSHREMELTGPILEVDGCVRRLHLANSHGIAKIILARDNARIAGQTVVGSSLSRKIEETMESPRRAIDNRNGVRADTDNIRNGRALVAGGLGGHDTYPHTIAVSTIFRQLHF